MAFQEGVIVFHKILHPQQEGGVLWGQGNVHITLLSKPGTGEGQVDGRRAECGRGGDADEDEN